MALEKNRGVSLEPQYTALLLLVIALLLGASVLFSGASHRLGIPVALIFILIGMAAGTDGLGKLAFDDYRLTFRIGTSALVLILFDGGLNTRLSTLKSAYKPAAWLATLGVLLTAMIVAGGAVAMGFDSDEALLLGAVVSSTDAASVFGVLRGGGLALKESVAKTLEIESGLNDPMAVILTVAATQNLLVPIPFSWTTVAEIPLQMVVGSVIGVGVGLAGRTVTQRLRFLAGGLYPVLSTALAFLAFAIPTLLHGSGFLAVYLAGVVLNNGSMPYRAGTLRVHDTLAWFGQVVMFLMLGLIVFPHRLFHVVPMGIGLSFILVFVARPVAVALCLWPFNFTLKEAAFIGWVGLRGAVPVILATFAVMANAAHSERIFDCVFFIVVVSTLLQGSTARWLMQKLDLQASHPPPPPAILEINSVHRLQGDILAFYIDPASAACDATIADLPFPENAAVMLLIRGAEMLPPRGNTQIHAGDHLYVFCQSSDRSLMELLFGARQ